MNDEGTVEVGEIDVDDKLLILTISETDPVKGHKVEIWTRDGIEISELCDLLRRTADGFENNEAKRVV